jgi:hypothetical protein
MSECLLNINNGRQNILFKSGFLDEKSPTLNNDRKKLFYLVCIPTRIFLACIVLYLSFVKDPKLQSKLCLFFIFITLATFTHLLMKQFSKNNCVQWWSNKFELILSFIAFILSLYCYFRKMNCALYVSIIIFLSIFAGIAQSIIINPFK